MINQCGMFYLWYEFQTVHQSLQYSYISFWEKVCKRCNLYFSRLLLMWILKIAKWNQMRSTTMQDLLLLTSVLTFIFTDVLFRCHFSLGCAGMKFATAVPSPACTLTLSLWNTCSIKDTSRSKVKEWRSKFHSGKMYITFSSVLINVILKKNFTEKDIF